MNVAELCKRDVVGIEAESTLRDAATRMAEEHVGSLVVVTSEQPPRVVGMVTDRDLALEVLGADPSSFDMRVGDLAKSPPIGVNSDASIAEAVKAMEEGAVRRLLVVDDDGGVVGLVSMEDLLAAVVDELGSIVNGLRKEIEHERGERKVMSRDFRPHFAGSLASQ